MVKEDCTHYYLIDLENVGLKGLYGLNMPAEGSEIRIFLSNAAHTGTEDIRKDVLESKAEIGTIFCSVQGKNAMDFQLSAYFGAVLERPDTRRISIISNDGGYKSLADYAKKQRKEVVVYQGSSILEAYIASEKYPDPRIYEKGKGVDFKQIMEELKKKQEWESVIPERVAEMCDGKTLQQTLALLRTEGITAKAEYLGLLKIMGREKGLEAYRILKNIRGV